MSTSKPLNVITRSLKYLWSLFLSGLITLLPITITVVIFNLTFTIVGGWLEPVQKLRPNFLKAIPHSEIIIIILAIFLVGVLLKTLVFKPVLHSIERLITKIPLVDPVYTGVKQLVHAFGAQDKQSFKKVVIVEFPKVGIYSIGFVTSEIAPEFSPQTSNQFLSVFIPTTPNPTSGFLVLLPETQVTTINLSHQEAMALIISGGIIQPDRFKERTETAL